MTPTTSARDLRLLTSLLLGAGLLLAGCAGSPVASSDSKAVPVVASPVPAPACDGAREILEVESRRAALVAGDPAARVAASEKVLGGIAALRNGLDLVTDAPIFDAINTLALNVPAAGVAQDSTSERAVESSVRAVQDFVTNRC